MRKPNSLLRLEKLRGAEVRLVDLPAYFPNLDRSRVVEAGVRAVFNGSLVPGKTPGRYIQNSGDVTR